MRASLLASCFLVACATAQGQNKTTKTDEEPARSRDLLRVSFLSPGIAYEKSLAAAHTLVAGAQLNSAFVARSSAYTGETEATFYLEPGLFGQYRYYYNFGKRSEKGRSTDYNSANFVGPLYEVSWTKRPFGTYDYEEAKARPTHTIGLVWGMQRNLKKRFSFLFEAGPGYLLTTRLDGAYHYEAPTIISHLSLGFWLNKRSAE